MDLIVVITVYLMIVWNNNFSTVVYSKGIESPLSTE